MCWKIPLEKTGECVLRDVAKAISAKVLFACS